MTHKVREYRERYGLSQQEIADNLNVSRHTYRDKEHGKIEFRESEMFELADFYNISVDQLFKKGGKEQ